MTSQNLAIFEKSQKGGLPDFAKDNVGLGMENVSQNDMSTPQLKLLQGMSPELQELDNVRVGQFLNSVSHAVYDELLCVNLFFESHFTIFNKKARERVDSCKTRADAEILVEGLPGEDKDYEIQDTKVNYCVALDFVYDKNGEITMNPDDTPRMKVLFPFIMYMKKTQIKVSNDWNTQIMNMYGNETARWAGIWKLTSRKRSNEHGTWYVPSVEFAGFVPNEELFNELAVTYQHISNRFSSEKQSTKKESKKK